MSNIFLIKGDTLVYPLGGVLKGITGEVVLKLAEKHFKIEERPVAVKEIKEADEIFITGTNKQVLPIVKIDDIVIGKGKVGEKAKLLQKLFKESTNK